MKIVLDIRGEILGCPHPRCGLAVVAHNIDECSRLLCLLLRLYRLSVLEK